MKIIRIECIPTSLPRAKPFITSQPMPDRINAVLLKIHTDEGITGIAESGDTSVTHLGESQDSILSLMKTVLGPQVLLGEDPLKIEKIVASMDSRVKLNNQAKSIVDIALHDIAGKTSGVPVYQLLGGKTQGKIPLHYVLSSGTPQSMSAEAARVVKAGFKHVRLKVAAQSPEKDVENIRVVRETVGEDIRISADANEGWHYLQALAVLKKLEPFNLSWIEQPVPWWDVENLARLREKVRIPVYADESLVDLSQAAELIRKQAVDGFILKLQRIGGLLKAGKCLALAQAAGLPVSTGCIHGSGVESAAYAHLAASSQWLSISDHGFNGPLIVHDVLDTVGHPITGDIAVNVPRYQEGFIYPPEAPGLGVELNEELVGRIITPGMKPVVVSE